MYLERRLDVSREFNLIAIRHDFLEHGFKVLQIVVHAFDALADVAAQKERRREREARM